MLLVLPCEVGLLIAHWIPVYQEGLAMQLLCAEEFRKLLGGSAKGFPSE